MILIHSWRSSQTWSHSKASRCFTRKLSKDFVLQAQSGKTSHEPFSASQALLPENVSQPHQFSACWLLQRKDTCHAEIDLLINFPKPHYDNTIHDNLEPFSILHNLLHASGICNYSITHLNVNWLLTIKYGILKQRHLQKIWPPHRTKIHAKTRDSTQRI